MKTPKERLMIFRDYLHVSTRQLEIAIGVSNSAISHTGDNLSANIIEKTCATYPQLDKMWLLTGDGQMLRSATTIDQSTNKRENNGGTYIEGADAASVELRARITILEHQIEVLNKQLEDARADKARADERVDKLLNMLQANG